MPQTAWPGREQQGLGLGMMDWYLGDDRRGSSFPLQLVLLPLPWRGDHPLYQGILVATFSTEICVL